MKVFEGKLTGKQFFWRYLPMILLSGEFGKTGPLSILLLVAFCFAIVAAVKRAHDLNRDWWFGVLLLLLPFAGLYLIFAKSKPSLSVTAIPEPAA